jgi:predicted N-acetyltransferase YhbS
MAERERRPTVVTGTVQRDFRERQRDGQLFALYVDDRLAAVVTHAFEAGNYWFETIGDEGRWWVKSLAVIRAWRGKGVGKRVMLESEAVVRDAGASEVFIDCVDAGFLPAYYARLGYEARPQANHLSIRQHVPDGSYEKGVERCLTPR